MSELFTPGPWFVRQWEGDEWPEKRISVGPERDGHAIAVLMSPRYPAPNTLDDAQLAAAAPDMYAALCMSPCPMDTGNGRTAPDTAQHCYETGFCVCKACDAFSKVRGETP